jgi:hypothetical protein
MIDYKRVEFLEKCAELSNDSWGEMLTGLLSAYYRHHSLTSTEFLAALEKEIIEHIEWAEENCKIVPKTEKRTVTFYELEVEGRDY